MSLVVNPYSYFTDTNGDALNGYLYIGEVGKNAENYPIAIYYDALLTTPAPNPLTVSAGYIYNGGTIAQIYAAIDYSLIAKTTGGSLVYSSLNESGMTNGAIGTIDEMKNFVAPYNNYALNVLGYSEAGDGGGGLFYYDANSTEDDNSGTIIEPTSGSGRWIRRYNYVLLEYFGIESPDYVLDSNWIWDATIDKSTANLGTIIDPSVALDAQGTGSGLGCMVRQYSGAVNVKWFGAKGDYNKDTKTGTNNTIAIQSAINTAEATTGKLVFQKGGVYLTDSLYVHNGNVEIDGQNTVLYPAGLLGSSTWALINVISTTETNRPFIWTKVNNVTIKNLTINYDSAVVPNPTTSPYNMIEVFYSDNFVLENCRLVNNYISADDTTRGSAFITRGECNNVVMRDCYINNINYHGVGHTNRYVVGDYTIAAGVSGTDTYASEAEISGILRPKNTLYENNTINNCRGYALDTHTVGGICTIQNNHSIGCTAFNKDQYGATHIIGNYIEQGVNTFGFLIWVGYDNSYIDGTRIPKVSMVIRDNFFKNCVGKLKIDRQCIISGNTFYSDNFTYSPDNNRISINIQQTENIIISNNIFREYWDTGFYIEAKATSPSIQNQIIIEGNIFELYSNFNAQYRLINLHSTSYVSIVANTFNEVGIPVSPAFPVFCLVQDSNYVTVSNNTSMYGGTSIGQSLFWNVTAGKTRHIITSNIAPSGSINGTVDVNANNILVV